MIKLGLFTSIRNYIYKVVNKVQGNSLTKVTDDPRVSIDPREYQRIEDNIHYYADQYPMVSFINVYKERQQREFKPLNMTKTAARRLASIIFNEKCEVNIGSLTAAASDDDSVNTTDKSEAIQDFIEAVLEDNDFKNRFEEELEKGIAIGDFAIRPYVDSTDHDKIKLAWIRADQFYPLRSNTNAVTEACISSRLTISENHQNVYYTLLEFHEWQGDDYIITNELYKSTDPAIVGDRVSLAEQYPDLEETVTLHGLNYPLFAYFKTPGANNKSLESPLGVGLVDNSKEVLDAINSTHDNFVREIELGRRRQIIPEEMVRYDDKHRPIFDSYEEGYIGVGSDEPGFKPTDITNDIRVDTYNTAMDRLIKEFEIQIGLSTGTFSQADSLGTVTATQVVADNSMTYQTRSSYLTKVEQVIKEMVRAILELAITPDLFTDGTPIDTSNVDFDDLDITVQFDDGVFVDKKSQADLMIELTSNGLVPDWYAIMKVNDLPESEARKWAEEIKQSKADAMPTAFQEQQSADDPFNLGGDDDGEED